MSGDGAGMEEDSLSISALASLGERDPERLQLYANNIQQLELAEEDFVHHGLLKNVSFPKLERVVIDASDKNEERLLEPYLQPNLKAFVFYGGPISDTFLEKLQKACPQLEELLIDNPRDLISPEGFIRFINGAKSLQRLIVMFGMDRIGTDDVFATLAAQPGLQSLQFQKVITARLISFAEQFQQELYHPTEQHHGGKGLFPQLYKLVCNAEAGGLLSLSPHLTQLSHLDVTVVDNSTSATVGGGLLSRLATSFPQLQFLKVGYTTAKAVDIPSEELVTTAQMLKRLQHIHLYGKNVRAYTLENAHIAKVVDALPTLKVLRLAVQCTLTETSLIEVGRACGKTLTICELWGRCNLLQLEGSGAFFSVLKELILGEIVPSTTPGQTATEVTNVVRVLKSIAPGLESFESLGGGSFAESVGESFSKQPE